VDETGTLTDDEWRQRLTPAQYRVLRGKGTERPFSGDHVDRHDEGSYRCAGCGTELFASGAKFESGTGWPSFYEPAAGADVALKRGLLRTEVHCGRCGGHLGHVFNDGPRPTGKRYCINSCALTFDATDSVR